MLSYNADNPQIVGGDMMFGHGGRDFLVDSPTAVAQAVLTRLKLWQGEWYLNLQAGTPWMQRVLGFSPGTGIPDSVVRQRILTTPYVTDMTDYTSSFNSTSRVFAVSCKLYTAFGQVTRAPNGALMSPSGNLVLPLSLVALAADQARATPQFMSQRLLPERF
jgi:hypothetical protein